MNYIDKDKIKIMFLTERLTIRPLLPSDLDDLIFLDSDPAVMKYINGGVVPSREDYENIYLPRQAAYSRHDRGWGLWHCSITRTKEFIGWVLSRPMDFFSDGRNDADIELGWRFVQSSWGSGYATEAAVEIAHYVEQMEEVKRISAIADDENLASIKIMKKLGMQYQKKGLHKDPLGDVEVVYYWRDV